MVVSVEESDFCKALVCFISSCVGAKSCWYSLKVVSDEIPSLPEAIGLSYESMMYMFQCCGLAGRKKDGSDWVFFPQKFSTFRNTHDLQLATDIISSKIAVVIPSSEANASVVGEAKKVRKQVYFIRLGAEDLKHIVFAGSEAKAPRIRGIVSYRSELHDTLWKLAAQYQKMQDASYTMFERFLLKNKEALTSISTQEEELTEAPQGKNEPQPGLVLLGGLFAEEERRATFPFPAQQPGAAMIAAAPQPAAESSAGSLLVSRIRMRLLPLLIQDDAISQIDSFWRPNPDEKKIESALLSIAGSIHEEKEKALSAILETGELDISPKTLSNPATFPKLRQYGIPLDNKGVHKSILCDLFYISKKTTNSSTSVSMELNSGEERSLVLIPRATSFKNMVRNEKEVGWFSELLKAMGGNVKNEAVESRTIQFVCHILARKYKDTFIEAVKQTGTQLIESLDPIATFAIQSVCNLPGSKMKLLKRFLEAEIGARIFSSPREIKQVLGMDSVLPVTGIFHYAGSANVADPRSREKVPWMYKSVKDIVKLIIRMQVREKKAEFRWNHLDLSTCIDHGKGFLRATLICVIRQLDINSESIACSSKFTLALLTSFSSSLMFQQVDSQLVRSSTASQ